MSHALKFEPNAALQNERNLAKAEFVPVKQAVESGAGKSPFGSFRSEYKARPEGTKQQCDSE
jgi:hypothetical protein